MAQKQRWVSLTAASFQATLDNLKGLVMEDRNPPKDMAKVVGEIKKTVKEALGREAFVGLQRLAEVLTVLDIAADHFEADGLADDAADLRALHKELKSVKARLEAKNDA